MTISHFSALYFSCLFHDVGMSVSGLSENWTVSQD